MDTKVEITEENAPRYWTFETSGKLAAAMTRYLEGEELSDVEVSYIRAYLKQWINSPVWDQNPHIGEEGGEGRLALAALRQMAERLRNRAEISRWVGLAEECGIDPL